MDISKLTGMNVILNRFRKDVNDVYEYKFKLTSIDDYELKLKYTAKGRVLKTVFNQVKNLLAKNPKLKLVKDSDPDVIEGFKVPDEFKNRVHIAIKNNIKDIDRKELNRDGIYLLRSKVEEAEFRKQDDNTLINIKVVGQYVRREKSR